MHVRSLRDFFRPPAPKIPECETLAFPVSGNLGGLHFDLDTGRFHFCLPPRYGPEVDERFSDLIRTENTVTLLIHTFLDAKNKAIQGTLLKFLFARVHSLAPSSAIHQGTYVYSCYFYVY